MLPEYLLNIWQSNLLWGYKDTPKASLQDSNIPTESWEQIAQDRAKWRGLIRRGARKQIAQNRAKWRALIRRGVGEQIAQDRAKWRDLIRRSAGEYEAKRISEAEQKRAQRKPRAKASPTELSSSDLSCSICSRQFRAKIGLITRLRTHKQ